jgi:dipeptidyl aminopeptidase/acylaminoacyl peptidase
LARPITAEDLYRFAWVDHVRLDPTARRLAFHLQRPDPEARENRSQVHAAPLDAADGPRELTAGKADRDAEWSPDGGSLAFVSKRGPRDQVFVLPAGGGDARKVTSLPDGAAAPRWSPDGTRIGFLGTVPGDPDGVVEDPRPPEVEDQARRPPVARIVRRLDHKHDGAGYTDGRRKHLFVAAAGGAGEAQQLTSGEWDVTGFDWSPDAARWGVTGNAEPDADRGTENHLYVVDGPGALRRLSSGLNANSPAWSPRGDLVAFLSATAPDGGRHERIWVVTPDGGEPRCLTAGFDQNVGGAAITDMRGGHGTRLVWSEAGDRIYFQAGVPGGSEIYSVDLEGAVRVEVTGDDRAVFDFDVRQGVIAFIAGNPWSPADLYVSREGKETRLSDFNPWLAERDLAIPERHAFTAADGLRIDGWLLRPPGFEAGRRYPLVMEVHGGPHAQYGWTFFHEFQVLAGLGFLVFYVNPRGSDGRDEAFKRSVVRDWGGADYHDLMAALDQLIEATGFVDTERMGIGGGSYGGYMTNWVIGQTRRFKAAVAMRSIANLVSEYAQHDIVPWGRSEIGPEPWPDSDELWRRSPIRYARDITTPLLLTHGEMDLRCAISQAEEMFGALRLLGKEVELVRFPGESHDLSRSGRPDRRVERLNRIAGWFAKHLLAEADVPADQREPATSSPRSGGGTSGAAGGGGG